MQLLLEDELCGVPDARNRVLPGHAGGEQGPYQPIQVGLAGEDGGETDRSRCNRCSSILVFTDQAMRTRPCGSVVPSMRSVL
jgi:hypothetical protein